MQLYKHHSYDVIDNFAPSQGIIYIYTCIICGGVYTIPATELGEGVMFHQYYDPKMVEFYNIKAYTALNTCCVGTFLLSMSVTLPRYKLHLPS